MATVLITEQPDVRYIRSRRSGARERLLARACSSRLDRLLAEGASPDSAPMLSLHARELIGPWRRREAACGLERVLRDARRGARPWDARAPVCRRKVLDAALPLREVARRLLAPAPVDAHGVALVRWLLSDGASPVYSDPEADDLITLLVDALEALEPRF